MGKSVKSQLAFAAKKCHPIKSFFVTKIPTTRTPTASLHRAPSRESIEEDNVNPTNPSNPSISQNTNQYTNMGVAVELTPTASTAFAAANESNKYSNISAHGESIEEDNVNPTNPSINRNTNQYTNMGVAIELTDKEKRAKNKKILTEVLQKTSQFKAELSVPHAFRPEHWKVLISQMENDGDYTNQLFFGQSRVSQKWRVGTLVKARAKLGIGIIQPNVGGRTLGETTAHSARSAIEVAKRVTSAHTLRISDDVAANDVAVGQVVSTLEAFRGGVTPIIPSSLTSYFAVRNSSKARNLVIRDYDSVMMIMAKSYDYETAKNLAAELKDKHGLSANFSTFTEDSYKTPTQFTSANEIHRMCMLPRDDLHAEV